VRCNRSIKTKQKTGLSSFEINFCGNYNLNIIKRGFNNNLKKMEDMPAGKAGGKW
jgi:hypothetical protein